MYKQNWKRHSNLLDCQKNGREVITTVNRVQCRCEYMHRRASKLVPSSKTATVQYLVHCSGLSSSLSINGGS